MEQKTPAPSRAYERREYQRMLRKAPDRRLRVVARLRRVLGWVCAAAFVLFCAANLSLFSRQSLRQLGAFVTDGLTADDTGTTVEFETGGAAVVTAFGDGLAVADNDALSLQKPGTVQLTEPLGYGAPVLDSSERYVLAYDRGGYGAVLASRAFVASRQTLQSPILFGCVGESGDYALVTNEAGYKSAVTVFSSGGKQRFKWATPDYYFQAAALSPDGKRLAITAFRQEGTTFETTLIFRELDSEAIPAQVSLNSTLPLVVGFLDDGTIAVVGDHQTFVISRRGKVIHEMQYATGDLSAYAFGGGSLVVAVRSYVSTARADVITIGANGRESAPLAIAEELQAIDYDGARLALLTAGGLTVYDSTLHPLWENASAAGARSVCLTPEGAVWLAYPKQAEHISSASDTSEVLK